PARTARPVLVGVNELDDEGAAARAPSLPDRLRRAHLDWPLADGEPAAVIVEEKRWLLPLVLDTPAAPVRRHRWARPKLILLCHSGPFARSRESCARPV